MKAPYLAIRERRYAVESSILDGRGNLVKLQVSALTFIVMAGTCQHEAKSIYQYSRREAQTSYTRCD